MYLGKKRLLAKDEVPKVCEELGGGEGVREVTLSSFGTCSFDLLLENLWAVNQLDTCFEENRLSFSSS